MPPIAAAGMALAGGGSAAGGAAIAGGTAAVEGIGGAISAGAQEGAAREAQRMADEATARGQKENLDLVQRQTDVINRGGPAERSMLRAGYEGAEDAIGQGRADVGQAAGLAGEALQAGEAGARADLLAGAQAGVGAAEQGVGLAGQEMQGGLGAAEGALGQGLGAAEGSLGQVSDIGLAQVPGATTAIDATDVTGTRSREAELYDTGLQDFQGDPGYQFRLQQGEQALGRMAAARGGRGGGRAMKEMAKYSQGLASDEYQRAFGRQAGLARGADAFGGQIALNQAGRQDQAALAAQRNQMGLAAQGMGALGQRAGMQFGAGQQMAGYGFGAGQQMAGLQAAQGQYAGNAYQNAAQQAAQYGMQTGQGLAANQQWLGGTQAGLQGQMAQQAQRYGQDRGASQRWQARSTADVYARQQGLNQVAAAQQAKNAWDVVPYTGGQEAAMTAAGSKFGDTMQSMYQQGLSTAAGGM